jgi:lysozyme
LLSEQRFFNAKEMAKKVPIQAVQKKPRKAAPRAKKKSSSKKSSNTKWIVLLFCLLSAGIVCVFFWKEKKAITVASFRQTVPKGFPTIGIDVSHHQGEVDWELLMAKSGFDSLIHFVYCKATEGNTHIDTQWETNRKTLNNMGIPNGAYHFFIPTDPPRPQATHFLTHWKKRDIDLPPVLDVETEGISDKDLLAKMQIWLQEVEVKCGMRPIIYTSLHFYETKFKNAFPGYQFWIAGYSKKPDCIEDKQIIHWQYSETGSLPGIDELVDLNVSKLKF